MAKFSISWQKMTSTFLFSAALKNFKSNQPLHLHNPTWLWCSFPVHFWIGQSGDQHIYRIDGSHNQVINTGVIIILLILVRREKERGEGRGERHTDRPINRQIDSKDSGVGKDRELIRSRDRLLVFAYFFVCAYIQDLFSSFHMYFHFMHFLQILLYFKRIIKHYSFYIVWSKHAGSWENTRVA